MDDALRLAVAAAHAELPDGCRYAPASEEQLLEFEREFGPIPTDFRWYLSTCGGGVCGAEWIDDIVTLPRSHRKFKAELGPRGWTMPDVFIIGWDGGGNPFGIELSTGRMLVEDHDFGGIHEMACSFSAFLSNGLLTSA